MKWRKTDIQNGNLGQLLHLVEAPDSENIASMDLVVESIVQKDNTVKAIAFLFVNFCVACLPWETSRLTGATSFKVDLTFKDVGVDLELENACIV